MKKLSILFFAVAVVLVAHAVPPAIEPIKASETGRTVRTKINTGFVLLHQTMENVDANNTILVSLTNGTTSVTGSGSLRILDTVPSIGNLDAAYSGDYGDIVMVMDTTELFTWTATGWESIGQLVYPDQKDYIDMRLSYLPPQGDLSMGAYTNAP